MRSYFTASPVGRAKTERQSMPHKNKLESRNSVGGFQKPPTRRLIRRESMTAFVPIIKVASVCNLACTYCYDLPRRQASSAAIISEEVLERSVSQVMSLIPKRVRFIWHGGEPLIAGMDLVEKIVEIQQKYRREGQDIQNDIQVNGTLLTQEWIDFLQQSNFCIGLSLDGPQEFHDQCRVTHQGRGTWREVMQAIEMLQERHVNFGLLTVVSKVNVHHPDEVYRFFIDSGLTHFDFLPHVTAPRELAIKPMEFANFMIRIFDLWMADDDPVISIRYLESALMGILGGTNVKGRMCSFAGTCSDFITIDTDGNIGPCDNLIPLVDISFGNIIKDDLETVLAGTQRSRFVQAIVTLPSACTECEFKSVCNGGCTRNRYLRRSNLSDQSYLCSARRAIFQHIRSKVEEVVDSALVGGASELGHFAA